MMRHEDGETLAPIRTHGILSRRGSESEPTQSATYALRASGALERQPLRSAVTAKPCDNIERDRRGVTRPCPGMAR
eukprot:2894030-Pyramimonas_sp.AAC.1